MLLAIDASRAAEPQKTGVGWYCHHLLQHLKDVIPHDVRVIVYSDQSLPEELRPWPENWEETVLRWPPTPSHSPSHWEGEKVGDGRWPLWSQVRLATQVLHDRPDILFIPAHVIPKLLVYRKRLQVSFSPSSRGGALARRSLAVSSGALGGGWGEGGRGGARLRLVTTIHDVVFKQFPESYPMRERWYANHATQLAVRHADRIIVPTEAVKRDLERWYRCASEKVVVVHHGVEHSNAPNTDSNASNSEHSDVIRSIRMFPERYILYVGRLERKKNVARMVEAFSRIAPQYPNLRFVLAGPPGFGYEEVRAAIDRSPVRDRIIETGWVDQMQYHQFLSSASVFLFPTLGEGFGLPILEAMAAGVPVIISSDGAHGEVAGNAALLVNPESTEEIAVAIDRTLRDANLRSDLVRRGQHRAAQFTWTRSAQETWSALNGVLSA